MDDLSVLKLYEQAEEEQIKGFSHGISSSLRIKTDFNKVERDFEWLDKMEETIRYLDNILRNPNRFIINEEEVVKIELARRVTVDSIKHLSRNTNFIQEIDPKTEEVKPSKILNINKEESFDTYENRFIYSLIKNMNMYIARKEKTVLEESPYRNNKNFEYQASAKVGGEKINVSLMLDAKASDEGKSKDENDGETIGKRIEKLKLHIADLTNTEVYKNLARAHVALVTSPIKKTNVILKNTNFQYAVALWNYLQSHVDDDTREIKDKQDYSENGQLKKYIDETVLLDYLVADSINKQKSTTKKARSGRVSERLVANMVEKIIDVTADGISEEQLKDLVSKQYKIIRYKAIENDKAIQKRFKDCINEYMAKISKAKL